MKNKLQSAMLILCILFLSNCSDNSSLSGTNSIGLETENEDAFSGKTIVGDTPISYSSKATDELTFAITVVVNKKTIIGVVDYQNELVQYDGHDLVLTELEKETLLKVGGLMADHILDVKKGDIAMVEYALLMLIEYWGKSPVNYVYSNTSKKSDGPSMQLTRRDEGISCIRKNTYVNAEYDDSRGNHSDRVKVGSKARTNYGCMGRCGADCGRWWIPSSWTKDCLDHDQCSNVNRASGGSSDPNCGDEYDQAIDDYVFGVIRGCRG